MASTSTSCMRNLNGMAIAVTGLIGIIAILTYNYWTLTSDYAHVMDDYSTISDKHKNDANTWSKTVQEKDSVIKGLNDKVASLESEKKKLVDMNAEKDSQVQDLGSIKNDLEACRAKEEQFNTELGNAKQELDTTRSELEEFKKKEADLTAQVSAKQDEINKLSEEIKKPKDCSGEVATVKESIKGVLKLTIKDPQVLNSLKERGLEL